MKSTYLSILFLFLCNFGMGQFPGTPYFFSSNPTVYTYGVNSPTPLTATVTGEIITRGQRIQQSGIIWGTSPTLTIESATGSITTVSTTSGAKSTQISGLEAGTIYYIAYYTIRPGSGTTIGNILSYEHGVVTTVTGRTWLQWNLGATAVPTSINLPAASLGSTYQWGRGKDGHETRVTTNKTLVTSANIPKLYNQASILSGSLKGIFLHSNNYTTYSNWLDPNFDPLWQGVNGINNPCPPNYRLPNVEEFQREADFGGLFTAASAFASPLKLQNTGHRQGSDGSFTSNGFYWTSTVAPFDGNLAYYFPIINGFTTPGYRIDGMYVRCIQDNGSFSTSGGTAKVQEYNCSGANGQMFAGVQMDRTISQTITADVIEAGDYVLNAVYKTIRFTASGTFTGTGLQTVVLNTNNVAPTDANLGTNKFYLSNINPYCEFERTVVHPSSYGTAIISSFNTTSTITGSMTAGVPVSGVAQTIIAQVATAGTYSLTTTTLRGITFSGSGSLTAGSNKSFTLTASGTPTEVVASASNIYTLNSSKSHSFGRDIFQPSSNGTAIISSMTAGAYSGASMTAGVVITGTTRTQGITINVTTTGNVNISATNNGVTFLNTSTQSTPGSKTIQLTASGTPIASGTFTFTTNTTPSATFSITFQ